jgi:TfoX/Sxy family transcriptional regulator of competence genes
LRFYFSSIDEKCLYFSISGIAAITGIIGVFATALLVAVISQKLELTRSENYVHNFVANIELAKAHKDQAANVVKYGWKVWYLRRRGKPAFIQYIQAQRKLLTSIHLVRKIKQRQRKLADNYVTLLELFTIQRSTSASTDETSQRVILMERKVDKMEDKLIEINQGMFNLQDKLNILIDRVPQR